MIPQFPPIDRDFISYFRAFLTSPKIPLAPIPRMCYTASMGEGAANMRGLLYLTNLGLHCPKPQAPPGAAFSPKRFAQLGGVLF